MLNLTTPRNDEMLAKFPFSEALRQVKEEGFVRHVRQVSDLAWTGVVDPELGSLGFCRIMAERLPGQGFPTRGKGGCSWLRGREPWGYLLHPDNVPGICEAQGVVEGVIGRDPNGWSIGNLARKLLQWIRPGKQDIGYTPDAERLLNGIPYGYHECLPGTYPYTEMHDVSGYYYNMMERLPSLSLYVGAKRLEWLPTDQGEMERFRHVLRMVKDNKKLRNNLAGNMAGPSHHWDGTPNFRVWRGQDGVVRVGKLPSMPGRFRAAGLLLVRSGAELTQLQCSRLADQCVYSNIDCVITTGETPDLWKEYGFRTKVEHVGETEVLRRYCYRIGQYQSKPFQSGYREVIPAPRTPVPDTLFFNQWM